MSVARGGSGFEDSVVLGRGLDSVGGGRAAGGGLMVYLVVMRVCGTLAGFGGGEGEREVRLWVWLAGGGWIV